eukprot:5162877-Prymnesium_polylepis.1
MKANARQTPWSLGSDLRLPDVELFRVVLFPVFLLERRLGPGEASDDHRAESLFVLLVARLMISVTIASA